MLNVGILNVIRQNVIRLSVVRLGGNFAECHNVMLLLNIIILNVGLY
jgi:hypothetical protein